MTSPFPEFEDAIRAVIKEVEGKSCEREGLRDTPRRVAHAWKTELMRGYLYSEEDIQEILTDFDKEQYDEMVILRNIEFESMCEHHLMPFTGSAHVAYVPGKRIVGVSKLARILDIFSKRLQVQERISQQVVQTLTKHLKPKGAACILEAKHSCISCRGVKKQSTVMVTSAMSGCFKEDPMARQELMTLIGGK